MISIFVDPIDKRSMRRNLATQGHEENTGNSPIFVEHKIQGNENTSLNKPSN